MTERETSLKGTIVQIVTQFEQDQMWITPNPISVTLEPGLHRGRSRKATCKITMEARRVFR